MDNDRRDSQEHILFLLKTKGPLTAQALAERLGITAMGVRQHLKRLTQDGLVDHRDERSGVGRPARHWSLTSRGHARFPDSHGELTVALLDSVRRVFGAKGLDKLISARTQETAAHYRECLEGQATIEGRLAGLAELRSAEGYMAEWHAEEEGTFLFIENHCPVCAAARICQGLCRSELEVFREALGKDWHIERCEHLLDGARRCCYRVSAA
ncbi:MAG: transcriptional regulator [Proteobacteria bacterium]|nr:transcriptional regulator [Pseudomonadota bacterium]